MRYTTYTGKKVRGRTAWDASPVGYSPLDRCTLLASFSRYAMSRTLVVPSAPGLALKGTDSVVVSCVRLRPLRPEFGKDYRERRPALLAWTPLLPGLARFAGHRKQPVHVQGS